jgi:two-component sensor histidine kinase
MLPRLIASLIGLIVAVSLVLTSGLVLLDQRRLSAMLQERATAAADHLEQTLAFPVWNAVLREIDAQLESTMLDPALYSVVLTMRDIVPPVRAWSRDGSWAARMGKPDAVPGNIELKRTIRQNGKPIASLELQYSTKFLSQSAVRESSIFAALVLAEALSLAVGLALIMRKSIFLPLRGIERWAAEVSLGDFKPPPPVELPRGEIAGLHSSIERMVSLLEDRYEAVAAAEIKTRAALEQKGAMVKELFHRTRNSLQMLTSMIGLRENSVEDETARAELRGILDRVYSLSLAQEELLTREDLSYIELGSYLRTLTERMVGERAASRGRIATDIAAEEMPILLDVALPLGLAITELVENSLEHAFPDGRSGVISLTLKRLSDGSVLATLSDDGIGPPPGFDPASDPKLGLETVSALIKQQLKGKLDFDFSIGFACSIRFSAADPGFTRRV